MSYGISFNILLCWTIILKTNKRKKEYLAMSEIKFYPILLAPSTLQLRFDETFEIFKAVTTIVLIFNETC